MRRKRRLLREMMRGEEDPALDAYIRELEKRHSPWPAVRFWLIVLGLWLWFALSHVQGL